MSADCGKLKNSNCFRHAHKGDFPKFGHICSVPLSVWVCANFNSTYGVSSLFSVLAHTHSLNETTF